MGRLGSTCEIPIKDWNYGSFYYKAHQELSASNGWLKLFKEKFVGNKCLQEFY